MSLELIALDLDNTIAFGREEAKIEYAKLYHGIEINAEQATHSTYPLGKEKYDELRALVDENFNDYRIAEGCKEVLENLSNAYRFAIVTARDKDSAKACYRFIEKHGLPIENVYCTSYQPKKETCEQIGAKIMLDDSMKELMAFKGSSITPLLFASSADGNYGINAVRSWEEFYGAVRK